MDDAAPATKQLLRPAELREKPYCLCATWLFVCVCVRRGVGVGGVLPVWHSDFSLDESQRLSAAPASAALFGLECDSVGSGGGALRLLRLPSVQRK